MEFRIFWYRALDSVLDFFVSVELTALCRLHLVYAREDGKELITLFTSRFASLSTMVTLLVGTQVATLFSPSRPAERARTALEEKNVSEVAFWAGFFLCLGIIFSILSLGSILTAWATINAIGSKNAHIILRSSICLYAATLPVRLSLFSIYLLFVLLNLFWYVIAAWDVALPLTLLSSIFVFHIIPIYNSLGRVIMYSGSIGDERIMEEKAEELNPPEITAALLDKLVIARQGDISVSDQYRIKYQEQLQILEEGGSLQLSELRLSEYRDDSSTVITGNESGDGKASSKEE